MPIQWPRKLNFQHKIIEKKLFLPSAPPPPLLFALELLNKYSKRGKEFNPSAMFGIQNGREGKMGVKTFIAPLASWRFRPTSGGVNSVPGGRALSGIAKFSRLFFFYPWPSFTIAFVDELVRVGSSDFIKRRSNPTGLHGNSTKRQ